MRKKAKKGTEGWWRSRADDLMQDIERKMYDECLVCGGPNQVGHHYQTKQSSSYLRYDFNNLIPLCNSCHFKHHIMFDPYIAFTIVKKMGKKWAENIEADRRKPVKTGITYYQQKCEEFEKILNNHDRY